MCPDDPRVDSLRRMTTPDAAAPDAPEDDLSQEAVRREKRARLLEEGHEPYPVVVARTHSLAAVREQWDHLETGEETQDVVGVAGRVEDRLEAHAFESDADRGVLLAAEPDLPHLRRPALQLAQRDVGLLAGDG